MKEDNKDIKNEENKVVSNEEVETIEIDEDLDLVKDVKSNDVIMKEKVNEILKDLDSSDVVYKRKKRNKTIFYIIGIIIEIIVIILIIRTRYVKNEISDEYKMSVKCSNTTTNSLSDSSIKMTNTYYFNDDDKVVKTENEVLYAFNNQESYNRFKSDYISTDIKDYKGLNQQSIFDDNNYIFKTQTIYTYSELKKNKKVSYKNNVFTLDIPNRTEPIVIAVEDYDTVLNTNENMGFICE